MNYIILLYIGLIILLHVIPLGEGGTNRFDLGPIRADYLLHTLVFIPWMFLFYIKPGSGWKPGIRPVKALPFLGWLFLGIILAMGAEGIQYWVDYRAFNPMDAVFNALGVVVGAGVFIIVQRSAFNVQRLKKKRNISHPG
jgi:glycopeptide antibiotics resistance protein